MTLEMHFKDENDISIKSMPKNLQSSYCFGKYHNKVIDCVYYSKPICLYNCKYTKIMRRLNQQTQDRITRQAERTIVEMAGQSLEVSG